MHDIKRIDDLRRILSEEITKLRKGETTAASVNAITNASGKILSSVKLEIEYNKLLGKVPEIGFILPSEGKPALAAAKDPAQELSK